MNAKRSPAPPKRLEFIREARAFADATRMTVPLLGAALSSRKPPNGRRIMLLPGFGADDYSMKPLQYFLKRSGYEAEGWGLGRNLAGMNLEHTIDDLSEGWPVDRSRTYRGEAAVPYLADRVVERVRDRAEESGQSFTLIGWSLGGYLAREAARDLPDAVDRVITLGSPIVGGPKYTATADSFRRRGLDLDWIEEEIEKREARPIGQPITAIYSKSDAIVDWVAAIDRHSPNVEHVEVDAAHLGLAFNPTVWRIVLDALGGDDGCAEGRPEDRHPVVDAEPA